MAKPQPPAGISRRQLLAGIGIGAGSALLLDPFHIPAALAATPTGAVPTAGPVQLFDDPGFNFSALTALGMAGYGVTEVGEVITAVNTINAAGANFETFTATFLGWADRLAQQSAASADRVSKGECALRASQYYAQALFYVLGTTQPGRELAIYQACRANWEIFVNSLPTPVQRLTIPVGPARMPAWLFRPDNSDKKRPTVILTNGSDGQSVDLWSWGGAAGISRGWNVLIYEGPGQGAVLFEQKIPFSDRWEQVVGAVIDALTGRRGVDRHRIALTGLSMGGALAPRAAAFEHRLAALVCEPGVTKPWDGFPEDFRKKVTDDPTTTNQTWNDHVVPALMQPGALAARYLLAKRYEPFGAAVLDAVRQGKLPTDIWTPSQIVQGLDVTAVAANISAPTLVLNYEDEQFYPGQAEQLFSLLTCPKDYVTLTTAEGANLHCSPMAPQRHNEVVYDWLEQTLQ